MRIPIVLCFLALTICGRAQEPATQVVNAPSNLTATVIVPGSRINLSWQDNSINEVNFIVQRGTAPSGAWGASMKVGPNTTTYQDNKPGPQPLLYYRVQAADANGFGPFSNVVSVDNTAATPSPSATASPSPSPTPTPTTPTPTASPSPTATPTPSPTPTVPPTPSATATPTSTPSPSASPTPTPSATPAQLVTVTVVWTATTDDRYTILYGKNASPEIQADGGIAVRNGPMTLSLSNLEANTVYYFSDIVTNPTGAESPALPPITYTTTTATTQELRMP